MISEPNPKDIAVRAYNLFGPLYLRLNSKRMQKILSRDELGVIIDMECVAELEIIRQRVSELVDIAG